MNINLKQKNLKVIQLLFVFSLACYIIFGATIDFSFNSRGIFASKDSYITGFVDFQSVVSKLMSVAFISHFNQMFVNHNSTLINSDPKLARINSTLLFNETVKNSLTEMTDSIVKFIKLDSQSYLSQDNAFRAYLYDWREWSVDSERTSNMTFFNYIKSLSVTITESSILEWRKLRAGMLYLNIEMLISDLYDLQTNLKKEFRDNYSSMEGFLFYFILSRYIYKCVILLPRECPHHQFFHQSAEKLEFDFHSLLKNQK